MLLNNPQVETQESYKSLAEIRQRKDKLLNSIHEDDEQIKKYWDSLFSKSSTNTGSKQTKFISGLMGTSAGIIDGLILGWKLYRKFRRR